MKLFKFPAGNALIILYYTVCMAADIFLCLLVWHITGSYWPGFGASFALSIGIGIFGSELEFREHCKARHNKHINGHRSKDPNKVINFPLQS